MVAVVLFMIFLFRVKLRFGFVVRIGQVSYSHYLPHNVAIHAVGSLRTAVVSYTILCLAAAIPFAGLIYR